MSSVNKIDFHTSPYKQLRNVRNALVRRKKTPARPLSLTQQTNSSVNTTLVILLLREALIKEYIFLTNLQQQAYY